MSSAIEAASSPISEPGDSSLADRTIVDVKRNLEAAQNSVSKNYDTQSEAMFHRLQVGEFFECECIDVSDRSPSRRIFQIRQVYIDRRYNRYLT